MVDDLGKKAMEILQYAQNQGFNIFHGKDLYDNDYDIFDWDPTKDWKDFFGIAKGEGAKIIIASIEIFDSSKEPMVKLANDTDDEDGSDVEVDFTKYDGKVGSFRFLWVKDGIKYSLSEATDWYDEYKHLESAVKAEYTQQQRISLHSEFVQGQQDEVPEVLKSKSEEELAQEMVAFILKESPHASGYEVYTFARVFWGNKGLISHSLGPKAEAIRRSVDAKAQRLLEQNQAKQEKERMPKLVEQCLEWAGKNGLKKLTLGEVGAFISENDVELSREGQRLLWQKTNIELKTRM
jgi:hypothetical protein